MTGYTEVLLYYVTVFKLISIKSLHYQGCGEYAQPGIIIGTLWANTGSNSWHVSRNYHRPQAMGYMGAYISIGR